MQWESESEVGVKFSSAFMMILVQWVEGGTQGCLQGLTEDDARQEGHWCGQVAGVCRRLPGALVCCLMGAHGVNRALHAGGQQVLPGEIAGQPFYWRRAKQQSHRQPPHKHSEFRNEPMRPCSMLI